MLPTDSLHLLTVDYAGTPAAVQRAFEFSLEELRAYLRRAAREAVPLLLLRSGSALHLISTSQNHVRAFRPTLSSVHERTRAIPGSGALPVRVARGSNAARYLLRRATPFEGFQAEAQAFVSDLQAAAQLSAGLGACSEELAALVRMTEHAAARVHAETRLGRPGLTEAELELEALVAERIVEEELLAWQSSRPALRSSLPPTLSEQDLVGFGAEEPQSVVRMRVARVLSKLASA